MLTASASLRAAKRDSISLEPLPTALPPSPSTMASQSTSFLLIIIIALSLLLHDADAGWKFWKKNKSEEPTTTTTVKPGSGAAGAPDGSPSTSGSSASSGQSYRDWAVDLTGAGEPGRGPPSRPASVPGSQLSYPSDKPSGGTRQGSSLPTASTHPTTRISNGQQTSTLNVGPITPAPSAHRSPGPGPSSPAAAPPKGEKTWAQVAGGAHPGSTIPAATAAPAPSRVPSGAAAATTYSSNPTYSKGNTVTDEDLEKLSESLWIKDKNNAWQHIRVNLQRQTSSSSMKDEAPEPLLTVNPEALQIPTIAKVLSLYDNYQLDTRTNEYISPAQRTEESLLVDTFLSTGVMSAAMRFLADKGFLRKDYYEYKDTLRRMWFNLYSRGEGKIGSAGFEHVFLTEVKLGNEVSGLHNWIYFSGEEAKRRADYLGYMKKLDLGDRAAIVKLHARFNNIDKPVTTMFIGTSPELEMALYTVCFFARPEGPCPVSLGSAKFNIITHKFKYRGYDLIGSAYPDI